MVFIRSRKFFSYAALLFLKLLRKITTKKQIQSWPCTTNPGSTDNNLNGKNTQNYELNEFDRIRVKQFLSETKLVKDLHRNIHTKLHSNPFSGSQEEDSWKWTNQNLMTATNFKMATCEGQNFIDTLWETIFSSSSRETPNRILPNLAHLLILCVFTSVLCHQSITCS
jgi:hypothetical protein